MANPALNERTFSDERLRTVDPRIFDPTETWRDRMTLDGVVIKSAALLLLVAAFGVVGWSQVERTELGVRLPGWLLIGLLGGLGIAIVTMFKPNIARFTAPIYAVVEGLVLGAISAAYDFRYDGIVVQAVGLTIAVFALMLVLFATKKIEVTDKLRTGVMAATGAIFLVYMVSLVVNLFGGNMPFIHDSGPIGIGFSLFVVGLAAFNLLLDFDVIQKGIAAGAPKQFEWYSAFGLLVTLVWLYLELLRLLAKLRDR